VNTPDFIENEHPKDGELSVTSMGRISGPIERDPTKPSRGGSLATPNLGVHVMDRTKETDVGEDKEGVSGFDQTNGKAPGLEGDGGDNVDRDGDGILVGDEIDMTNPFGAILGDEEEPGLTAEDRDPAVTPNSEEHDR
jgi:hypothetical protein